MQPPPPLTAAPTPPLTKKIYEFSCFELLCIHTFIISRWLFSDFNTKKSLQLVMQANMKNMAAQKTKLRNN
jgi:hypothetical protein